MFSLIVSRLFNHFFLPPGLFILILIAALVFYFLKQKKVFVILVAVCFMLIYILSIEPVKNLLLAPLEGYAEEYGLTFDIFSNGKNSSGYYTKGGVIVVLGGGINEYSPDFGGAPTPLPDASKRTVYAYLLYKKTGMPVITSGGRRLGLKASTPEGYVLKDLLIRFGVPAEKIIAETDSKNTFENIRSVKKIMKNRGFNKAFIVTSAYHIKRTMWICKIEGLNAVPVPTDYKISRSGYSIESLFPSPLSLYDSAKALHEYFGIVYYRLIYR